MSIRRTSSRTLSIEGPEHLRIAFQLATFSSLDESEKIILVEHLKNRCTCLYKRNYRFTTAQVVATLVPFLSDPIVSPDLYKQILIFFGVMARSAHGVRALNEQGGKKALDNISKTYTGPGSIKVLAQDVLRTMEYTISPTRSVVKFSEPLILRAFRPRKVSTPPYLHSPRPR